MFVRQRWPRHMRCRAACERVRARAYRLSDKTASPPRRAAGRVCGRGPAGFPIAPTKECGGSRILLERRRAQPSSTARGPAGNTHVNVGSRKSRDLLRARQPAATCTNALTSLTASSSSYHLESESLVPLAARLRTVRFRFRESSDMLPPAPTGRVLPLRSRFLVKYLFQKFLIGPIL